MAKSLRSKRERKLRAVKRIRYGAKELERLKKTLGTDNVKKEVDEVMTDMSDVVTVTDSKTIKEENAKNIDDTEKMDDDTVKHVYNIKTLRDQFGSYPVWMNQRRTRKMRNESKLKRSKKTKKTKSKQKKK